MAHEQQSNGDPVTPSQTQRELHAMRVDYQKASLDESDVLPDPLAQFRKWFNEARPPVTPHEPNAMTVATASADGTPSARIALLKDFDERGFTFYTNYESRKGHELAENPRVALLFYWEPLERQVRIDGTAERVSREESAAYFKLRPRGAQIGAWASHQSDAISSRADLERRTREMEARFGNDEVPLPDWWGGYRVTPLAFEFWQGRSSRLHDRIRYRRDGSNWQIDRLSP